jgi:hypothetical protein
VTAASTDRPTVSRPLLIGVGLVAIAAIAYLLLTSGQSDDVAAVDPAASETSSEVALPPVDPTEPSEEASEVTVIEPTFEVFSARDPFDQLVVESDAGGVEDTQDTTTTTPTDDSSPGTEPSEEPAQQTVGTTTIRLDEVFREGGVDMVVVEVNSTGYEAAEDETVAGDLTVLDIADSCATMRFEDTRFILCEGEQIQK